MHTDDENQHLIGQIVATAEVIGTVISGTAAALIAEDLERYPHVDCCAALKLCRAEVRGRLTLSDVVNRINANDGRPSKDEAWGIALQSSDERDTVVWTPEISVAYDAARAILRAGDKVGARMAFMAAYERLVVTARSSGQQAQWAVSAGWDVELRDRALESAVKLERLPLAKAKALGYLTTTPISADGRAIAGLLTGSSHRGLLALTSDEKTRSALLTEDTSASREASPEVKARLQKLRADMIESSKQRDTRRRQLSEAQRNDLAQRKAAVQIQVDAALKKDAEQ